MRLFYWLSYILLNVIFRILFGFRVIGNRYVPLNGRVIIAANHQSFIDPLIVGASVPREVFYIAKEELFRIPLLREIIRLYNAIPVRRSHFDTRVVKQASSILRDEQAILVFPEGTRSRSGQLQSAKMGVGMLALQNQADIVPMYIHGTFKLRKFLFRYPGIVVLLGDKISIRDYLSSEGDRRKEAYRKISQEVMGRIRKLKEKCEAYIARIR